MVNVQVLIHSLESSDPFKQWIKQKRWFRSKTQAIKTIKMVDTGYFSPWLIGLVEINFNTKQEVYFIPLQIVDDNDVSETNQIVTLDLENEKITVVDATQAQAFKSWFGDYLLTKEGMKLNKGTIYFKQIASPQLLKSLKDSISDLGVEQSNTSYIIGEKIIAKLYRQLEIELNPEVEMLLGLSEKHFEAIPELVAHAYYENEQGQKSSLAMVQAFIKNQGDGWQYVLKALEHELPSYDQNATKEGDRRQFIESNMQQHFSRLRDLGRVTGRMHDLLSQLSGHRALQPVKCQPVHIGKLRKQFRDTVLQTLNDVEQAFETITDKAIRSKLKQLMSDKENLFAMDETLETTTGYELIRYHGDYHLGQVMNHDEHWMIIDFEGEPLRSIQDRRQPTCPLKDVAGMLRSFNYAAHTAIKANPDNEATIKIWEILARDYFLAAYLNETLEKNVGFLPASKTTITKLLNVFELEKAMYELHYELNNRHDWIDIPLSGILKIMHLT